LIKAARPPAAGSRIELEAGVNAEVLERKGGEWTVRMECREGRIDERLERIGRAPLPPYIRRGPDGPDEVDHERYQTVYAARPGAIAAPTAGLHFTDVLLQRLAAAGVERTSITLHVGLGTFQPVSVAQVEDHSMHEESFELPPAAADAVAAARRRGGRVVAVGTTVVRTLESCARSDRCVVPRRGRSALFIYPGYRFAVVDALITNFHLPRSTLLMLVSAFAGRERVLAAYREALQEGYRFYSYGDAMLIEEAA
jgi:S-adenosylmethionine:tRNA ribosyltransferase-isomerase